MAILTHYHIYPSLSEPLPLATAPPRVANPVTKIFFLFQRQSWSGCGSMKGIQMKYRAQRYMRCESIILLLLNTDRAGTENLHERVKYCMSLIARDFGPHLFSPTVDCRNVCWSKWLCWSILQPTRVNWVNRQLWMTAGQTVDMNGNGVSVRHGTLLLAQRKRGRQTCGKGTYWCW